MTGCKIMAAAVLLLALQLVMPGCEQEKQAAITPPQKVKRVASLIKVRPEFEERYIIIHKHTFPGVLKQIYNVNIRNYSIFLKDGILFSYFEYIGDDYAGDMQKIADETTREWWKLTDPMQEPLETRKEGEWWAEMEEVFHWDGFIKPSSQATRHGQVIELRPEFAEEYYKVHANVWPGVLEQIQRSNIQNYSIFSKDGRLYTYFEYTGVDFAADMAKMQADSTTQSWWKLTDPMQKKVPTAGENEWWAEMREVFHTD